MISGRLICVLVIALFAVTIPQRQRESYRPTVPLYDRDQRYPVVDDEEVEPTDPIKLAKLKRMRQRYNPQ